MNHSFPRLLTLLRKEQKLSQKDAAKALGISQALLSHYENGIRECGLDFLVKAADFYQVSCDYLLGRTPIRTEATKQLKPDTEETPGNEAHSDLLRSFSLVFRQLEAFHCQDLSASVLAYLKASVYQVFRLLYTANAKNPQNLFQIGKHFYRSRIQAKLTILENQIDLLARGKSVPGLTGVVKGNAPIFSMDLLSREDPACSEAIQTLIQHVEET